MSTDTEDEDDDIFKGPFYKGKLGSATKEKPPRRKILRHGRTIPCCQENGKGE
jgi:hypothetical protein